MTSHTSSNGPSRHPMSHPVCACFRCRCRTRFRSRYRMPTVQIPPVFPVWVRAGVLYCASVTGVTVLRNTATVSFPATQSAPPAGTSNPSALLLRWRRGTRKWRVSSHKCLGREGPWVALRCFGCLIAGFYLVDKRLGRMSQRGSRVQARPIGLPEFYSRRIQGCGGGKTSSNTATSFLLALKRPHAHRLATVQVHAGLEGRDPLWADDVLGNGCGNVGEILPQVQEDQRRVWRDPCLV